MPEYQVFISFKNTDAEGQPTRDSVLAKEVYDYLTQRNLTVFFSSVELEAKGTSAWRKAIDEALETAHIMIVICTNVTHIQAEWVRYEWVGFSNDILGKIKPFGQIFVYIEGMRPSNLPRGLRNETVIPHASNSLEMLFNYVKNALQQISQESIGAPSGGTEQPLPGVEKEEPVRASDGSQSVDDLKKSSVEEEIDRKVSDRKKNHTEEAAHQEPKTVSGLPDREIRVVFPLPSPKPSQPEKLEEQSAPVQRIAPEDELHLDLGFGCKVELVMVPEGDVLLGSDRTKDPDAEDNEIPQHLYHLKKFYISKFPITIVQFDVFSRNEGYSTIAQLQKKGFASDQETSRWITGANWMHPRGSVSTVSKKSDHPVTQIAYVDAIAFCKWVSQICGRVVRLPTEAEWERSARGDDGRIYPWGDAKPNVRKCNFGGDVGDTTPVGKYSPQGDSPFGCSDMAGNVWEWTSSLEKPYPYQTDSGKGNKADIHRIIRGGSYFEGRELLRCACRKRGDPSFRCDQWGFRILVEAAAPPFGIE